MNRRGFLGSILAACAAPAIVRADSLMRIVPTETTLLFSRATLAERVAIPPWEVREWLANDIVTDEVLCRFDVIGRDASGAQVQLGVDLLGGSVGENRDMALALLMANMQRDGITPIGGAFPKLPEGARIIPCVTPWEQVRA